MNIKDVVQKHSLSAYFITTFTISWIGAFIVAAPKLFSGQPIPTMDGILMFPVMILGPVIAGIVLTKIIDGKTGLHNLKSRMGKWKVAVKWYLIALSIPPLLILFTLTILKTFVSPLFIPNFFPMGFLFGTPAGFLEETGWTGFAFPKMLAKYQFVKSSVMLGFIWGLWHLPVIDFLGAASPHGKFLISFAVSFIAAMAAIRVIICWIYAKTHSVLLAQFMHVISTSSLVIFGPNKVSPVQESLWYFVYAVLLWFTICIFSYLKNPKQMSSQQARTR